jgi:hypothetical protein
MPLTIDKALEILQLNLKEGHRSMPSDVKDALALACCALHAVKLWRRVYFPLIQDTLPGEQLTETTLFYADDRPITDPTQEPPPPNETPEQP